MSDREKFEDGVLTADACAYRYSIPRDLQYRTSEEDLPDLTFGRRAIRDESELISDAHTLRSAGFKLNPHESLEKFVLRHSEYLGKEVV